MIKVKTPSQFDNESASKPLNPFMMPLKIPTGLRRYENNDLGSKLFFDHGFSLVFIEKYLTSKTSTLSKISELSEVSTNSSHFSLLLVSTIHLFIMHYDPALWI